MYTHTHIYTSNVKLELSCQYQQIILFVHNIYTFVESARLLHISVFTNIRNRLRFDLQKRKIGLISSGTQFNSNQRLCLKTAMF